MAKNTHILILLLTVCSWGSSFGQSVLIEDYPTLPETSYQRKELIRIADSQVGVRELTGRNDGKEVEMYLRSVGLGKGYAWCAAYVTWCHAELNIPNPRSAWSPSWFTSNVVYRKNHFRIRPFIARDGQVFGLYYENLRRVGHVGFISGEGKLHYYTIEGNTSGEGSRDGDGVYRRIRRKESIYVIADHVGAEEIRKGLKL